MNEGYLASVAGLLWPAPARLGGPRDRPDRSFVLVPSAAAVRLVLPTDSGVAAATACRSYGEARSARARARGLLLASAFRSGLGPLVFRDRLVVCGVPPEGGLDDRLQALLGQPVHLALWVGPPRATRKPVVQVLDRSGRLLAFVKLGRDRLTDALVDAEAAALGRMGELHMPTVEVPRVLEHGEWAGHRLLVQSALPVHLRRAADQAAGRARALAEIARSSGVRTAPLAEAAWWRRLRTDAAALPPGPAARPLDRIAETLDRAVGRRLLPLGAWHGDFNPGNTAVLLDRVLVWDWERFETDVPLGFDALHLALQDAITRQGAAPDQAVEQQRARAVTLLAPLGLAPEDARLVAVLYWLELGTRYARDAQAEAGADLGRVERWLLPTLQREAAAVAASEPMTPSASGEKE